MSPAIKIFKSPTFRRILIFSAIGFLLYLMGSLTNVLLLTFIFTYLLYNIQHFLVDNMRKVVKIQRRVIIITLYLVVAAGIGWGLYKFTPLVVKESIAVIDQAYGLYKNPGENAIAGVIVPMLHKIDMNGYIDQGVGLIFNSIKKLGGIGIDLLIAFVLSLFFQLERKRILAFAEGLRKSKIGFIAGEIGFFGGKFLHSFGNVIQAQILISLINCGLTVLALWLLGFPKIFGLAVMVFLFGLIPVAGVIVSLIPLSMIAYSIGHLPMVGYLVAIVLALHSLQTYFLYPKLMSTKTNLPLFMILLVLIIAEYCFGVWGLIVGIPLFVFILEILDIPTNPDVPKISIFKIRKKSRS